MFLKLKVSSDDQDYDINNVGFIIHKNPTNKYLNVKEKLGNVNIFFKNENNTLNIDHVFELNSLDLFRKSNQGHIDNIDHYVNDQSYTINSMFSSILNKVYSTCVNKKDINTLKEFQISVEFGVVRLHKIKIDTIKDIFIELGFDFQYERLPYNPMSKETTQFLNDMSDNYIFKLSHNSMSFNKLFNILIVMTYVYNVNRHFEVSQDQLVKLIERNSEWLKEHSKKQLIVQRFLSYKKELTTQALSLLEIESLDSETIINPNSENEIEKRESLGEKRYKKIYEVVNSLSEGNQVSVVDFGSSTGKLIRSWLYSDFDLSNISEYTLTDVNSKDLSFASRKIDLKKNHFINIAHSSLEYFDKRFVNKDIGIMCEIIEHIEPRKLNSVLKNILENYNIKYLIITTPNFEYNKVYGIDGFRHWDHRFEYTRAEFENFKKHLSVDLNVDILDSGFIGEEHIEFGGSTQYVVIKNNNHSVKSVYPEKKTNFDITDVVANKDMVTSISQDVIKVPIKSTISTLELMSRYTIDKEKIIYIPPTMSPVDTSNESYLEHISSAFEYFKERGIDQVVCESKHMGSRGILVVTRDSVTSEKLFNTTDTVWCYTRTGRQMFTKEQEDYLFPKIHEILTKSGIFYEHKWVILDSEVLPWNLKGEQHLIKNQYGNVGSSGHSALENSYSIVRDHLDNIKDSTPEIINSVNLLQDDLISKQNCLKRYNSVYTNYVWDIKDFSSIKIAPFHIFTNNNLNFNITHKQHLELIDNIIKYDTYNIFNKTTLISVDLNDEFQVQHAIKEWETYTEKGQEGFVVKPEKFLTFDSDNRPIQPAIKVRGRDYLYLIYGTEYTRELDKLRKRPVKRKRATAIREYMLGLQGLLMFQQTGNIYETHRYVTAVLSIDSEPLDIRL